jgi:outer membrane murein-binding lipoprotein Lpp
MATMIDTLGYVKRLTAVGVSREQAEAHAEAFRDEIAAQVATKADLDAGVARLENKISALAASTKADLDSTQAHLDRKITGLDGKIIGLEGKIIGLEARFEGKFTLLHWMCGFNLATSIAVLWMLVRLLMK